MSYLERLKKRKRINRHDANRDNKTYCPWWNEKTTLLSKKLFVPSTEQRIKQTHSWITWTEGIYRSQNISSPYERKYKGALKRKRKRIKRESQYLLTTKRRKRNQILRTCKVRIYPTKRQRSILKKWIGSCRFLYNQSINAINENFELRKSSNEDVKYTGSFDTINELIGKNCQFTKDHEWLMETPSYPKSNAILKAFKARKTCFSLLKNGIIKKFKLHFKKKRDGGEIIIPKNLIRKDGVFYARTLGNKNYPVVVDDANIETKEDRIDPIRISKKSRLARRLISNGVKHNCEILMDSLKKYWLLIPYEVRIENQDLNFKKGNYVSLDPGVRTFQSYYSLSEDGDNGVFGELSC